MKHDLSKKLPDFDPEIEDDALWNLLDEADQRSPSPRFVQDTLRRVRLETETALTPWWKALFTPKPLAGMAGAALAAVLVMIALQSDSLDSPDVVNDETDQADHWESLEDTLASELLSGAAEDPSLLSDQEIVALLF